MIRDVVKDLLKTQQKAWEDYVKSPTDENKLKYDRLEDDLNVEMNFDRDTSFSNNWTSSSPDTYIVVCND